MSNSVDPDETAHYEPSHLDLRCLQKNIIIAYGSERVKDIAKMRQKEVPLTYHFIAPTKGKRYQRHVIKK